MAVTIKTEILPVCETSVLRAADMLCCGEVVAVPSETVYGLAADATNEQAVLKIFSVKRRPADNPLIVHCDSKNMALTLIKEASSDFNLLADTFWPGPLTIVTTQNGILPSVVTAGGSTVALRVPADDFFKSVITACGVPLAAPSANLSTRVSPTSAKDVLAQLSGIIPLIIDGGDCRVGVESSIIYLSGDTPVLLRPGDITIEELENTLHKKIILPEKNTPTAPGMKYKHYAPRSKITLYSGNDFGKFLKKQSHPFGAVCFEEEIKEIEANVKISFGRFDDVKAQQRMLFSIIKNLDDYLPLHWYIHINNKHSAVYNRLIKAAGGDEFTR